MKPAFLKLYFPLAAIMILAAAFCAFSQPGPQPGIDQKRVAAKAAFDEAIKLRAEGSLRSYNLALEKFQESAKLYEELGDRPNVGSALLGIGLIKNLLDENDAALEKYNEALEIFRSLKLISSEARTLNNIGRVYDEMGDKEKALQYHFEALPLRKAADDKAGEASTLNSIGAVYASMGERQKAIEYYTAALTIRRRHGELGDLAISWNNLGRVYDELGEKQKALEHYSYALPLRRAVGDRIGEAITLNNIGTTYDDLKKPDLAIEYLRQSLAIFTILDLANMKATVLNNIGATYLDLDEPAKTLEYNREALRLHRSAGRPGEIAAALNNIGRANLELGNVTQALTDLNQALALGKAAQEKSLEAIILGNLMRAAKKSGQVQAAIFYGKQSVNKYQELRRSIQGLPGETQKTFLGTIENDYRALADLLIEAGLFAQAEQVLRMLKEEEYFEFTRRDANEVKDLGARVVLTAKEQELIKRYSGLADRLAEAGREFARLDEKKRRLSRKNESLSAEEQKLYDALAAQLSDANAAFKIFLEKQLAVELGTAEAKKIEYDRNLQAKLAKWEKGTVALYTVITPDRYRVILTTSTVQIAGKYEIKGADLYKKIFAFREALLDRKMDPRPLGKELYDILIAPIEKDLQGAGAKTLLWSLDGALRYIPLAALSPDGKTYLAEKYSSSILTPKTRDDISASAGDWRALGVGISEASSVTDPANDKNKIDFVALPGAKKELMGIVKDESVPAEKGILTGRRLLDKDFTRPNFSGLLSAETADGKPRFTVVHIASHFKLGDDWSNSFLVMGDNKVLTLEQINNSPEINFGNVDLVTLSACNTAFTAYSNGKEIDSLAEAIQTKSGKAILATLWAISDEGTSQLMNEFYRFRKENPALTKADAMQAAQKALIQGKIAVPLEEIRHLMPETPGSKPGPPAYPFDETKPFAHPYYWSAFVLIGNWR